MNIPTRVLPVASLFLWVWTCTPEVRAQTESPALVRTEFVFDEGPVPSCHASTLVEARDGSLVAAWFAGTAEGKPDVGIWTSRNTRDAWSKPVEVATGIQANQERFPCWNPVLFQPKEGALLLFYKAGPNPVQWWGMLQSSPDNGLSWGNARRLPEGILGPIKNKPVQLPDGTLLCASSAEGLKTGPAWQIHFERSSDGGASWQKINVPQPEGSPRAIQPSLLQHSDGRLQAVGRTREQKLFSTFSSDQGGSWSTPTLLEVPNPNSGTDALTLKDGRHLLVYNHTSKGRSPLNIAVSTDGTTWQAALVLENQQGAEFSYPAIIQTADGLVHLTYTWKRTRIKHAVIDPAKIQPQPFVHGEWPASTPR